jgi:hypothetical protein
VTGDFVVVIGKTEGVLVVLTMICSRDWGVSAVSLQAAVTKGYNAVGVALRLLIGILHDVGISSAYLGHRAY